MLNWPDWNKLYANWQCLYFWVPFTDEQWGQLEKANESEKAELIRAWRENYLKNVDIVTGKQKEEVKEEVKEEIASDWQRPEEESIEDVKPAKTTKKKGK